MIMPANPALTAFITQLGDELVFTQVLVRRVDSGFELRHAADSATPPDSLREVAIEALRELAQTTETGAFRPLKSAPNLRRGWRTSLPDERRLETALGHLYPGAIADWFSARQPELPVTHYREFTSRQTGMYRITTMLDDAQAATVIRACCDAQFCLKRRLWTVPGLEPDADGVPSAVPCLEPCAVFLEFARKAARIEQNEKVTASVSSDDLETVLAALAAGTGASSAGREADFGDAANPRRMRLVWEKLRGLQVAKEPDAGH